ncbi:MAG: hypothetical protein FJ207_06135 [Gemmatimonadetes bacterium]|nr:hypothetical protein [Gemmatimonadota bacterium]
MTRWLFVWCVLALALPAPAAAQPVGTAADSATVSAPQNAFFIKGRDYGTDAYAGPFDVILNKGFAVAQWQDQDRHIRLVGASRHAQGMAV